MSIMIKRDFLKYLIEYTNNLKIKSFQIQEEDKITLVDFKNIKEYSIDSLMDKKILLANKYSKIFLKDNIKNKKEIIDYIASYCHEEDLTKYNYKIKSNDKYFYFNISNHAKYQFLKRYILFLNEYGDEVKYFKDFKIRNKIFHYIEKLKIKSEEVMTDKELDLIIVELMTGSKHLNSSNMGRKRDIKMFNNRDKQYNPTTRFNSHPFLFILDNDNKIIATVELYSSSFPIKHINDKIKNITDKQFFNIFDKLKNKYK